MKKQTGIFVCFDYLPSLLLKRSSILLLLLSFSDISLHFPKFKSRQHTSNFTVCQHWIKLLRHPASWTECLLVSGALQCEKAIVELPGLYSIGYLNKSHVNENVNSRTKRVQAWCLVEEWSHPPISKILTQNCFCLKEMQGQKLEQRLKERPSRNWPTWGSIPYTVIKPRHYC